MNTILKYRDNSRIEQTRRFVLTEGDDTFLSIGKDRFVTISILVIASLLSVVLFLRVLRLFFQSEDFYFLYWGQQPFRISAQLFADPLRPLFRPITRFLYWQVFTPVFGLTPSLYHLTHLLLHILNSWIVYHIIRLIPSCRNSTALFCSFIFLCHPIAAVSIGWISAIQDLLMVSLALGSVFCFFRCLVKKKSYLAWLSFLFYFLGILSKEQIILLPILLLAIGTIWKKEFCITARQLFIMLAPHLFFMVFWGIFLLVVKRFPNTGPYTFQFDLHIIKNLLISLSQCLSFGWDNLPAKVVAVILITIGIVILHRKISMLLFIGIWFIVLLVPVLPLGKHYYLHYSYFSAVAGCLFFSLMIETFSHQHIMTKRCIVLFSCIFVIGISSKTINRFSKQDPILSQSVAAKNLWSFFSEGTYCHSDSVLIISGQAEKFHFLTGFGYMIGLICRSDTPATIFPDQEMNISKDLTENRLVFLKYNNQSDEIKEHEPDSKEREEIIERLTPKEVLRSKKKVKMKRSF